MASNPANSSASGSSSLHNEPSTIIGPLLICQNFNWALFGTLAVQLYIYEKGRKATQDPSWMRVVVWAIFFVDTVQTVVVTQVSWHYAIDIWGDPKALVTLMPWAGALVPVFDGIVALMVQILYAWRIWVLAPQYHIVRVLACGCVVALSLLQFVASIGVAVSMFKGHLNSRALLAASTHAIVDAWVSASFTGDVIIAVCMICLLYQARSRSTWAHSQSLYDRLIANTVQTGLLTSIAAGFTLAVWKCLPRDLYAVASGMIIGKLYSNSFYSTLNGRIFRREESEETVQDIDVLPVHHKRPKDNGFPWMKRNKTTVSDVSPTGVHVHVLQEHERHSDGASTERMSIRTRTGVPTGVCQEENRKTSMLANEMESSHDRIFELSTFHS